MIDYQKPCLIDTKCLLVIETMLSSRTFRQSINYWQVPAGNEMFSQRNWLIMCRARPVAILTWHKLIYLTGHVRCTYVSITTLPTNHRSVGVVTWPLSPNKDLDRSILVSTLLLLNLGGMCRGSLGWGLCFRTRSRLAKLEVVTNVQKMAPNGAWCASTWTNRPYFGVLRCTDRTSSTGRSTGGQT